MRKYIPVLILYNDGLGVDVVQRREEGIYAVKPGRILYRGIEEYDDWDEANNFAWTHRIDRSNTEYWTTEEIKDVVCYNPS